MLEFLAPRIAEALKYININRLYELRLRAEKPLRGNLDGKFIWIGLHGVVSSEGEALAPSASEIADTLFAASDYSLYSVAEQIKEGFLTARCGERIGIAGTYVFDGNGRALSVHSVTSLCIRIPHAVEGCAEAVYRACFTDGLCSILILSPPGDGKTTILRDLSRLVGNRTKCNILVCDERGELSAGDLGCTADIIRFANKFTAFTGGLRTMRPDVIVTDELMPEDYAAVKRTILAGVKVFASAHLQCAENVPEHIFDRYVILNGLGSVSKIVKADGNALD